MRVLFKFPISGSNSDKHSPKAGFVPMTQHPRFVPSRNSVFSPTPAGPSFLPAILPAACILKTVDVFCTYPWIFAFPNKYEHAKDQVNVVGTSCQ